MFYPANIRAGVEILTLKENWQELIGEGKDCYDRKFAGCEVLSGDSPLGRKVWREGMATVKKNGVTKLYKRFD